MDCRHTGEHVREVVDVVRKSDNGLGSVGEKVEEVQDSMTNLLAAHVRAVHRCYSANVHCNSHVPQSDSTPQPGSMPRT